MNQASALSSIILNPKTYPGELFKVTRELYSIFAEKTGISVEEHSDDSTPVKNGYAVSSGVAAYCMIDLARTQKFSQALLKAIQDKTSEIKNRKVKVFYAGCGPYATLLSVIAPFLNDQEVEFTLVDIHQESLDAAKRLLHGLNVSSLVSEFLLEDASSFTLEKDESPDIVVSETMTAGLLKEPQVSIMLNLLQQTPATTVFIPQNVRLFLGGKNVQNKSEQESTIEESTINVSANEIDCVFDLEESLFQQLHESLSQDANTLSGKTIQVDSAYDYYQLVTHIDIYKDFNLKPFESSLTLNRPLEEIYQSGDTVKSKYIMNDLPHLELETIQKI